MQTHALVACCPAESNPLELRTYGDDIFLICTKCYRSWSLASYTDISFYPEDKGEDIDWKEYKEVHGN